MKISIYKNKSRVIITDELPADKFVFEKVIQILQKETNFDEITFYTDEPGKCIEKFKKQFQYIEAAGGLVLNASNQLLVIERLGKYDLPKGKAEKNEKKIETALREVSEECGINNLEIIKEIPSSYHVYHLNEKVVLKKTYWFLMKYKGDEVLKPQTEENIKSVFWIDKPDLSQIMKNTYRNLEKYFKMYEKSKYY